MGKIKIGLNKCLKKVRFQMNNNVSPEQIIKNFKIIRLCQFLLLSYTAGNFLYQKRYIPKQQIRNIANEKAKL